MSKVVINRLVLDYDTAMRAVRLAERADLDSLVGPDAAYLVRVIALSEPFPELLAHDPHH